MLQSEQFLPSSTTDNLIIRFWTLLKMFGLVMLSLTFMAFMISVVVRDSVRKDVNSRLSQLQIDLNQIHEQNKRSIDDRTHLNNELENTRASLKRLEESVKKEVMKP